MLIVDRDPETSKIRHQADSGGKSTSGGSVGGLRNCQRWPGNGNGRRESRGVAWGKRRGGRRKPNS